MQSRCRSPVLILALLFLLFDLAIGTCYYPNKQKTSSDYPCNPSASVSSCCNGSLGSVCLGNGLCQSSDGNIIRGSCTDQDWGKGCPNFCLSASTGGTDLISCSNVTKTDTSYCCDHTTDCCDTGVGRFSVLPSSPTTSATWSEASTKYVVLPRPSSSKASATKSYASSTKKPSSASSSSSAGTARNAAKSATATASPAEAPSQGLSAAATAGLGIGVGIGGLSVLAATVLFLVRRRRDGKAPPAAAGGYTPTTDPFAPLAYKSYAAAADSQNPAATYPQAVYPAAAPPSVAHELPTTREGYELPADPVSHRGGSTC